MSGRQYLVNCYHDRSTGRMQVETVAGSDLDIVGVGNDQILLGKDLIRLLASYRMLLCLARVLWQCYK